MTRQLYDLKHPLYPHPELLQYYLTHKVRYEPRQGSKDDEYRNWYQLVRADHDISGAPLRPIYREVQQIMRLKASGKEYLMFSEYLYGQDHEYVTKPFFHTYGSYVKPGFRTVYNYDTKEANVIPTGQVETIYFIPYDTKEIDILYNAGPDDADIELLVYAGPKQYGGRGFFRYNEFRDLDIDDLARIGRDGKGQFTPITSKIATNEMTAELYNVSKNNNTNPQQESQLYKEFQEFKKWKTSQQQPIQTIEQTTTTTTIKENKQKEK